MGALSTLDKFGTPRIFELIPYWTDQPTMEGTLMESSFTAPYHFVNQAELSLQQPRHRQRSVSAAKHRGRRYTSAVLEHPLHDRGLPGSDRVFAACRRAVDFLAHRHYERIPHFGDSGLRRGHAEQTRPSEDRKLA